MSDCSAIILAGGKSSRMGKKKALLPLDGKTFIEILIEKLERIGISEIILSGYSIPSEKVLCVEDVYKDKGPLAGLHAGLSKISGDFALVLAEDAPLVPEDYLRTLLEIHRQGKESITVTVCDGNIQALVAVYDRSLLQHCQTLLQGEKANLRSLIEKEQARKVVFDGDEMLVRGCNTAEEYESLCSLAHTEAFSVRKVNRSGKSEIEKRLLLHEHKLTIEVHDACSCKVVCTRSLLKELVYGRLCSEGIIRSKSDVKSFSLTEGEESATVILHKTRETAYLEKENPLPAANVDFSKVFILADRFNHDRGLHHITNAVHRCILLHNADDGGESFFSCEDIGRHNAIDKAVGYALLNDLPLSECMLFTSGRVSEDMVRKVIAAQIPVLVSKSVPTAEALALARRHKLTLICRAWQDSCEVYVQK